MVRASTASLVEVSEFFFEAERELGLLDHLVAGLPLWGMCRAGLGFDLLGAMNERDAWAPAPRRRRAREELRSLTWENPFRARSPIDTVVIEHPRAVLWEGRLVDVYTEPVQRELERRGVAFRVLAPREPTAQQKSPNARRFAVRGTDVWGRLKLLTKHVELQAVDEKLFACVEQMGERRLGASWAARRFLRRRLPALWSRATGYDALFEIWKPRSVYVVPAYTEHAPAVLSARRRGIWTVELQHGYFGRYHLGYSYPGRAKSPAYFPNELQVWSEAWRGRLPFSPEFARVTIRPSEWIQSRLARHRDAQKERALVVLSQQVFGERLAAAFEKTLPRWEGWKIYYKLHPSEVERAADYPSLRRMQQSGRVEVVGRGDLYELLARCQAQVGVYSTALYEGLEFGCRTFLLELPGVEGMRELVENGDAEVIRLEEEPGGS